MEQTTGEAISEICWQRAIDRGYIIPLKEN